MDAKCRTKECEIMKNCQADLKKNQIKYLEMRRVTGIRNNVGETEDETQPRRELVNWKIWIRRLGS